MIEKKDISGILSKTKYVIVFVLIFLLVSLNNIIISQYNYKIVDIQFNPTNSEVSEILSSELGYLYLAGKEAILQYDGKNFDLFHPAIKFDFAEIRSVRELENHSIYFLKNDRITYASKEGAIEELPISKTVNDFLKIGKVFFLGTDDGLSIYDPDINFIGVQQPFEQLEGIKINCFTLTSNKILIGTDSGIWTYFLDNQKLTFYSGTDAYPINKIELDGHDNIWAINREGFILNINILTGRVTPYSNQNHAFSDILYHNEKLWFSSSNRGLIIYDFQKENWSVLDQNSGLPDQRILDLTVDEWNNMWMLSASQKLIKIIDTDYIYFNRYNGLESEDIAAVTVNNERLFIAEGSKGVFVFNGKEFNKIKLPNSIINYRYTALYHDNKSLWVGTSGNGVIRIDETENTVISESSGLPGNQINTIEQDQDGNIWLGTNKGVAQIMLGDTNSITINLVYGEMKSNPLWDVTVLTPLKSGTLIFGTRDGKVGLVRNENASIMSDLGAEITGIILEKNKCLISTQGNGLFVANILKNSISEPVSFSNGKNEIWSFINGIYIDDGYLWISSIEGVMTLDLNTEDQNIKTFTLQDGFPIRNPNINTMTSYQNKVWVGGKNGMIGMSPIKEKEAMKGPKLSFSSILIDYNEVLTEIEYLTLGYNDHQISFDINAVNIQDDREIQFSYYLEGQDESWSPWTRNNSQSYVNLLPGKYTLKVRARSGLGEETSEIEKTFTVKGPFYKNTWFIIGSSAFFLALFYIIFRTRLHVLKKRNEEEKAKLTLENRLLELEQKAHQLQMNPHFIFNALNSIQATVARENYEMARKEISDFATLMRSILSNSRAQMIPLSEEIKLLDKYIAIEKKCRDLDFEYHIMVDDEIDEEETMLPPMIIQPFVENAIVHGLKNIDYTGQLTIKLSPINDQSILCTIQDNGIGFDNTKKSKEDSNHKSVAISVTKERLENAFDKKAHPVLTIKQMDKEKGGTEVKIKIPVTFNY